MNTIHKAAVNAAAVVVLFGCAGMSTQDRNTAISAPVSALWAVRF